MPQVCQAEHPLQQGRLSQPTSLSGPQMQDSKSVRREETFAGVALIAAAVGQMPEASSSQLRHPRQHHELRGVQPFRHTGFS